MSYHRRVSCVGAVFALLAIFCAGAWAAAPTAAPSKSPAPPAPAEKPAEKIAPSDHVPKVGADGRPAVMAFRNKNYIPADLKVGDGYVDGGHAMKFQKDDGVSSSREILTVDRTRDKVLQKELEY